VFARAAGAVCGMVESEIPAGQDKPLVTASMFGNTTAAVERARQILEENGYEVLVFHCTGTGGRTMESLIDAGLIAGSLDITTTEWADELVGGVFAAGPTRLEAAARRGVPAIVVPGCLDMVNFGAPETVPEKFKGRTFYQHNPNVTLMRTNVEENRQLGRILAEKINLSTAPVSVLIPLRGISVISAEGKAFYSPEADKALFDELKANLKPGVPVIELDCNINDAAFAEACAQELLKNLKADAAAR
ncbi:MAG TPA: Tm-1-like ATP-binding domain-containing protein, partial [Candidatus Sumerlaeota bacterium]|nr:Tm-1-like ATP-binding domain-containing protein [Candidatus Sumerlaeota bacterium]